MGNGKRSGGNVQHGQRAFQMGNNVSETVCFSPRWAGALGHAAAVDLVDVGDDQVDLS